MMARQREKVALRKQQLLSKFGVPPPGQPPALTMAEPQARHGRATGAAASAASAGAAAS